MLDYDDYTRDRVEEGSGLLTKGGDPENGVTVEISKMILAAPHAFGDPVKTILVIKLDHIGDFLLALPAMRRLREAFAGARITLACGPWNRELAASAALFDEIVAFDFFPEQMRDFRGHWDDRATAAKLHRRFRDLVAGSYDLAIDLRYDGETRRLLTMVDAKRRVGIADDGEFPFLDLAVPSGRAPAAPTQHDGEQRHVTMPFSKSGAPQWLPVGRKDLVLRFEFEDTISPRQLGVRDDERQLGLALKLARVRHRGLTKAGWYPDDDRLWTEAANYVGDGAPKLGEVVSFTQDATAGTESELGLGAPEAIGTWTVGPTAQLRLPIQAGINLDLSLYLKLEGYVPRGRRHTFSLWCNDVHLARTTLTYDTRCGTLIAPIRADALKFADPMAVSERFQVATGDASISVRIEPIGAPDVSGHSALQLEVINDIDRVLASRVLSGPDLLLPGVNELGFHQDDPSSPLRVRVTAKGRPFKSGVDLRGLNITTTYQRFVPRVHAMDWSGFIVDATIRHFLLADDMLAISESTLPPKLEADLATDQEVGRKILMIATGASKDVTKWPLAYFTRLVDLLQQAMPCRVYFVGAARDYAEAELISGGASERDDRFINACGATSLTQLSSLLKRADLFIGGSTGTTHMAAMSGVNTLALLSATNHPHQWAPVGPRASFLSLDVPCRECHIRFMSQCNHGYRCMTELTPELVFEQALALLGGSEPERAKSSASLTEA